MDRATAAYWTTTGLFAAAMLAGGVGNLGHAEGMREEIVGLGYPEYLMTILGIAKLLGVAAIAAPGLPRLKEWAYAGFTFDLLGAAASHAFVADPLAVTLKPLALLLLGGVSCALRPASRRLADASRASREVAAAEA